jgi:RimJ/RimL family protein N-acetyltransferase
MQLETKRLLLREFVKSDVPAVLAYASDPETVKYMPLGPGDARPVVRSAIKEAKAKPRTAFCLAVVLKESGQVIGSGGISMEKDRFGRRYVNGEVSWILRREYWNRGYGTELAEELLRFGFDELRLHRISAWCDAENMGSIRVMEHCGMQREGTLRDVVLDRDECWCDQCVYAILSTQRTPAIST